MTSHNAAQRRAAAELYDAAIQAAEDQLRQAHPDDTALLEILEQTERGRRAAAKLRERADVQPAA